MKHIITGVHFNGTDYAAYHGGTLLAAGLDTKDEAEQAITDRIKELDPCEVCGLRLGVHKGTCRTKPTAG